MFSRDFFGSGIWERISWVVLLRVSHTLQPVLWLGPQSSKGMTEAGESASRMALSDGRWIGTGYLQKTSVSYPVDFSIKLLEWHYDMAAGFFHRGPRARKRETAMVFNAYPKKSLTVVSAACYWSYSSSLFGVRGHYTGPWIPEGMDHYASFQRLATTGVIWVLAFTRTSP